MDILNSTIFTTLTGIGVLAAGLGFAYSQIKIGSVKAKDELIATLKDTAIVEREKANRLAEERVVLIQDHQNQINNLTQELGKLQGIIQANDTKLKEYIALIQDRDPELRAILKEIKIFLEKLAKQSDKNEVRNEEIDDNTQSEHGNIQRGRNEKGKV